MGKGSSQAIGFHYFFDILFGLGRGPFDELVAIKVGDKPAWSGSITNSNSSTINNPDLFGGEKKEGGIQGVFRLNMGTETQVLPGPGPTVNLGDPTGTITLPDVKASIGGLVSEMRGVVTLWYSGLICSMNPYPKEWKFRMRRSKRGWQNDLPWYEFRATIPMAGGAIMAMNPAHIIYECLTNKLWGRGLPPSLVDGEDGGTFVGVANTLYDEGFGLCFLWQRKEDVEPFVQMVLDHIGGVCYLDRETGKMVLRLIRGDYDPDDLPLFTPSSGLLEIVEDDSSSGDLAFNEVMATGHDPITDTDIQVRVHNLAARHSQGAANAEDKGYDGAPTKELLLRMAQRDLRVHAAGLKKFKVRLDRRGYKIAPGGVFRIQDTRRGITNIVLRAGEVVDPPLQKDSGGITISALQDVYGMPTTSFVTPVDSTWTPPPTEAFPSLDGRLVEGTYRDAFMRVGAATAATIGETDAYLGAVALAPNPTTLEYSLATRAVGEANFVVRSSGYFSGAAYLAASIGPLDTSFAVTDAFGISSTNEEQAILIDDELMTLVSYDADLGNVVVERGVVDTIPAPHDLGATVWTIDDDASSDNRLYSSGETAEAKILSRTSSALLAMDDADTLSVTFAGRVARPYPPGDVRLDGDSIYTRDGLEHAEPVITWTHRDRIYQADQLVPHVAASIGPEPGTTYIIRVYAIDGTTLINEYPVAGDTWTYDAASQTADGSPPAAFAELRSVRAGIESWQRYYFLLPLVGSGGGSGYGWDYGFNYGGA